MRRKSDVGNETGNRPARRGVPLRCSRVCAAVVSSSGIIQGTGVRHGVGEHLYGAPVFGPVGALEQSDTGGS